MRRVSKPAGRGRVTAAPCEGPQAGSTEPGLRTLSVKRPRTAGGMPCFGARRFVVFATITVDDLLSL